MSDLIKILDGLSNVDDISYTTKIYRTGYDDGYKEALRIIKDFLYKSDMLNNLTEGNK